MPRIEDVIAKFKAEGLDLAALPALVEELESAATEQATAHAQELSVRDAKVASVTEALGKSQADIDALKVKNYDLVMGAAAGAQSAPPAGGQPGGEPEDSDGDGPSIDDLFESKAK